MKSRLLAVALLSLLVSSAHAMSSESDPSLNVARKDSSSVYLVSYTDQRVGKVTVTVNDDRGNHLARRVIQNQNGFTVPINLSSVPEGVYTVQTNNGTETTSIEIVYNNSTAPTYSRVVNLGDGRYLFISTHVTKETITIYIYDGNGDLAFKEDRTIKGYFSMLFNLKSLYGKPSFEITETSGNSLMVPGSPVFTEIE